MSSPSGDETPFGRWSHRGLLYAAAGIALLYVGFLLAATEGHFVPQIVDLYLICQYARAFAEGHPFQYNAGEPPSTGATSLLFTALLGVADWIGLRGEKLVAFAIAFGAGCYLASVWLAQRMGARLGDARTSLLAGALVMLGGPVVWGFLYGSDIAPFMLLFLWLTERLLARHAAGVAVAGTLLALTRPEGLPIALIVALAAPLVWRADRRARTWLWCPVAVGAAMLVLYRWLTGYWVSTSVADKSLLSNYGVAETVAIVADYAVDVVRGLLLGFYPSNAPIGFAAGSAPHFFAPLALVLIVLGAADVEAPQRRAVATWAAVVVLVFLLVSPNTFIGVHFNRYLMWAFPTLHVFTAFGWSTFVRRVAAGDPAFERRLYGAGAAVLVVLAALSTARFASVYGTQAGDIYRRDVAAARWIQHNLRPGVSIANLATSIEYLTGHRNVNLHGVTSPAFFGNRTAEREAGVFESLGRLAPAERPEYLLTTVATHASLRSLQELVDPAPLYQTTSFGDEIVLYRMRYDLAGRNREIVSPAAREAVRGLQRIGELNVCDTVSERGRAYEYSSRVGNVRVHGSARVAQYPGEPPFTVIDAGRAILGHESFAIDTASGKDLVIVMRTAPAIDASLLRVGAGGLYPLEIAEASLELIVNGRTAQRLRFRPAAGWDDHVLRIPGAALDAPKSRIELRGRYTSFYYWFFQ